MFGRALLIWMAIVPVAIANGAVRDILVAPVLGDTLARALSAFTLSGAILLVTWMTLEWIGPSTPADAWGIGVLWLAMTLAFELVAGHYLFGVSWEALRADYNILRGRLWVLVLLTTLVSPILRFTAGHYPGHRGEISASGRAR